MDILKFPSDISLSGNMQKCIISTPYDISFVLTDNTTGEVVIEHSYSPSADHLIEVDLKPIIQPLLAFKLQNVTTIYKQPDIMHSFTVEISEVVDGVKQDPTSRFFKVFRTGVDELADSPLNFLKSNFLTWQPNVKGVTYYSPEFLTYYASEQVVVKCTAYVAPSAPVLATLGASLDPVNITLSTLAAGSVYTIPVSYSVIASKLDDQFPSYYDIWIETESGSRLTYIQRYYADDMKSPNEQWVLFENSLGGIDTFRAYGNSENTAEHTHNVVEIDENSQEYRVDTERTYNKNTGYLDKKERVWLLDFFPSLGKYIYVGNHLRRIVVTESDASYTAKDLPSSYTFKYKYADARPYLNIPRTDTPQDVLNITVPDLGSFTIAPRLVEFPRLTLSDGALLPIQDPYSEEWNATSIGELFEYVVANLHQQAGSGSGDVGHTHNNMSLLNALTLVSGYLLANGKKINAGFADMAGTLSADSDIWNKFIRKDINDTAAGIITFLQGLVSQGAITAKEGLTAGTYMDGLYGSGASIDKIGNAVFESIYARSFISAPEFRYNKITVTEGEQWNTNGYGMIESVDTDNRIIVLHLEENDYASVVEGDYCRGIYNNIGTTDEYQNLINIEADDCGFPMKAGFFTSYFRVSDIIESSKGKCSFRYELRNSKTPHPCAQMKFAQYANDIDETRQASAYFSSVGHFYFQAVEKVSSWVVRPENVTIRFGWVDGFPAKLKDGSTQLLRNYGLYVPDNIYFGNAIVQIDAKSVENIKTELEQYSIEISNAVDVITVDDAGNVIGGLYKLNPDNTKYDYRISPAVYVKKGNEYLVPAEDGDDSDHGTYKMYITPKNCTAELINGTICVTSIDNIKDGISGTSDDTEFDYDAMRKTESISVVISAICEGIGSISKEFHVAIKHDSKPYISFVMDNQNASVSWNTKAQKYIGLPYTVNLNARRADEPVAISGVTVHSGDGITTTSIINGDGSASITLNSLPQTLDNVTDVPITIQAIYAGISYEQTIVHTINRYEDVNVYELKPNVSQVVASVNTNGDKVASVDRVTCEVLCNSSDDKQYYLTSSDMENAKLTVKYSVDGGTIFADYTSDGVTVSPEWENIIFRLYLNGGLIDSQDVPVMLNGVDGEGIEYVFILSKEEVIPNITFNPDSEEYQKPDYLPTSTSANTEPQGQWTDDSNGVGANYPFEYCAIRRKQYGKWQPFATPKIWGRYAKDGENPYVIDLTNNSSSVLCNDKGVAISSYEDTTLIIFEGTKDVTSTFSISFQAVGITCEKSSTGYTYSFSNITTDVANVTFTAVKGNVTLKAVYTVARIKNGVMYSLVCSHDTVRLDNTGNPVSTDSTLYISVRKTTPEGSVTSTSVSEWQGWGVNVYYLNASGTYEAFKTSYDISYATAFGSRTYAVFQIRKSDGSTILDSERINAVSDGVSITGIKVEYQVSNSQKDAPTSWETTSPPTTTATPYLWTKTTIRYSKGNDTVKTACVGKMGDRGIDGNGTEWIYYLSNSSTFTGIDPSTWDASDKDDYVEEGTGWTDDPSGVTETNQYEWISQRTKKDGTWGKFSQPTIWAKWGEKGDNAVEYSLKPNMTSIIIDDNNKIISGSSLSVTLYKTAGSSTAQSTNYKIFAYSVNNKDEKTVLGHSSGNPSPFAVDIPSTIKDDLAAYYFEVHDSKNTLAVLTVPVVRHGKPSMSIVDRGLFDLNSGYGKDNGGYSYKYVNGTLVRDMVKYLSNNAYYYYMVKNRTDLGSGNVTVSPGEDSSKWEQASKYNLLVADVVYANNATFGGFHVDKDALWTGADSKDNATILLDGAKKKVRVTGEINATSGTFENCAITNTCRIHQKGGNGWFLVGAQAPSEDKPNGEPSWWLGYAGEMVGSFSMKVSNPSNSSMESSLNITPNIPSPTVTYANGILKIDSIYQTLASFNQDGGMNVQIGYSIGEGIRFTKNISNNAFQAFVGSGHGCLNGVVQGYQLNVVTSGLIDISKGNTVYCNGVNSTLALPKLSDCRNVLGTTGAFALDLTIIGASGASNFRVYGKYHDSTTDCYLLNNNHGDNWYATMSQGDVLQLKLIYTGSAFYAYIVSLMQ